MMSDAAETALLCRSCGHELGRTTATALAVNGVVLTLATMLRCSACGKLRFWRPLAVKGID